MALALAALVVAVASLWVAAPYNVVAEYDGDARTMGYGSAYRYSKHRDLRRRHRHHNQLPSQLATIPTIQVDIDLIWKYNLYSSCLSLLLDLHNAKYSPGGIGDNGEFIVEQARIGLYDCSATELCYFH